MVTQMMSRNWRDLIRPKAITLDPESNSESYGKFTCEPLERGFGITIGNSLRRILLSSLQGAAITSVRIDGVLHEFAFIPGIEGPVSAGLFIETHPALRALQSTNGNNAGATIERCVPKTMMSCSRAGTRKPAQFAGVRCAWC